MAKDCMWHPDNKNWSTKCQEGVSRVIKKKKKKKKKKTSVNLNPTTTTKIVFNCHCRMLRGQLIEWAGVCCRRPLSSYVIHNFKDEYF